MKKDVIIRKTALKFYCSPFRSKLISEILHISQRSYSHYETGSRGIPIEMLIRLADYYNTSIDYLVGRTNNKKPVK